MTKTVRVRKSAIFNTTERRWEALQKLAGDAPVTAYLMKLVEDTHGEALQKIEDALEKVEEALAEAQKVSWPHFFTRLFPRAVSLEAIIRYSLGKVRDVHRLTQAENITDCQKYRWGNLEVSINSNIPRKTLNP